MEIETYATALASDAPAPGGGSAATVVCALGAALVAMVARITLRNERHAQHHPLARDVVEKADRLRAAALDARAVDETAYARVVAATALPKTTPGERSVRTTALQAALASAAAAPLAAAETAKLVATLAERALAFENRELASDLGCAAEFACAALAALAFNVRINHRYMKDADTVRAQETLLARYERETAPLVKRVRFEAARGGTLSRGRARECAVGPGSRNHPPGEGC